MTGTVEPAPTPGNEANVQRPDRRPLAALLGGVLVVVVVEVIAILVTTHGHFTYTLDDAYIHLRVSERIFAGEYGVNPGVAAAASSSIIWPFLLAPFAGFGFDWAMPFVVNVLCTLGSAALIYRTLRNGWRDADPSPWLVAGVAFVGCLAFDLVPLAFTGLEHSLQLLLVCAVCCGLVELVNDNRAPWFLWAGIALLPLVRYEMALTSLVVALFAAAALRRWRPIGWFGAGMIGVAAFSVFLSSMGLPALPGSVLVKGGVPLTGGPIAVAKRIGRRSLDQWTAVFSAKGIAGPLALIALVVILIAVFSTRPERADRRAWLVALPLPIVLGHITFVGNAESDRYNQYLIVMVGLLGAAVAVPWLRTRARAPYLVAGTATVLLAAASFGVFGRQLLTVPTYSLSIAEQQCQMARLVHEELRAPVAVNDLGCVAYRNDHRVLDLWGLGSEEARVARTGPNHDPRWMERLMEREHVEYAFIYSDWFKPDLPDSWILVAQLRVTDQGSTAGSTVDFYARSDRAARRLRAAIRRFTPTLPDRTKISLVG